jgi:hypothetical protein
LMSSEVIGLEQSLPMHRGRRRNSQKVHAAIMC